MTDQERRNYQRVSFEAPAELKNQDISLSCHVIDLSIHGVLLQNNENLEASIGDHFKLTIPLLGSELGNEQQVCMSVKLKHVTPEGVGLECSAIDLDSITHLRKIVELNSGSPDLLERELELLVSS